MYRRKIIHILILLCITVLFSSIAMNVISAADNTNLKIDDSVGRFDTVSKLNAKLISNGNGVSGKSVSFYVIILILDTIKQIQKE